MIQILTDLAKIGPVIALLIAAILYFLKREKKIEEEKTLLEKELRDSEKDNLSALLKVSALMDKLIDNDKNNREFLIKEIQEFRKAIEYKIDNLNGKN